MKAFTELLGNISTALDTGALTLQGASLRLAEHIQGQLGCSRVGIWTVDAPADGRAMHRIAAYDGVTRTALTEPLTLGGEQLDEYFQTLIGAGIYASDDAWADLRLQAMAVSYLVPNDIRSALYAAIGVNGSVWGVLCCTQIGEVRPWSAREVRLLKRYADAISVRRARRRRREAEARALMQRLLRPHRAPSDTSTP